VDKDLYALTTGQAARYCFVTSDTILNWINAECLPAQRTVGGQYRILVDDLRHFLNRHGMSTDLLNQELETRCYCWEFHLCRGKPNPDSNCESCMVFKSMAFNCFFIRSLFPDSQWHFSSCDKCEYFKKWNGLEMKDEAILTKKKMKQDEPISSK
jgi:excisionase family DNA binding protein